MKKKLKVKKAALGRFFGRKGRLQQGVTPLHPKIHSNPNLINPIRPGMQLPRPTNINPNLIYDKPRPGMQQPIKNLSNMGPINVSPFNSTPGGVRGGMGPLPNNLGPTAPVGDPGMQQPIKNLSNMGPINVSPFNSTPGGVRGGMGPLPNNLGSSMPNPSIGAAQAAPAQPIAAMKKGGAVRGVRIALRGAKKAKIY